MPPAGGPQTQTGPCSRLSLPRQSPPVGVGAPAAAPDAPCPVIKGRAAVTPRQCCGFSCCVLGGGLAWGRGPGHPRCGTMPSLAPCPGPPPRPPDPVMKHLVSANPASHLSAPGTQPSRGMGPAARQQLSAVGPGPDLALLGGEWAGGKNNGGRGAGCGAIGTGRGREWGNGRQLGAKRQGVGSWNQGGKGAGSGVMGTEGVEGKGVG